MNFIPKIIAAAAAAGTLVTAAPSSAFDYSGKTITFVIGYGFGGTYGKYSRTMAEHLKNHIPGKPNIIVQSQPGAGGIKATNFAYNVMQKNGFNVLVPPDAIVVSQLLRPKKVKYNAREFRWVGSTNQTNTIFVLRKDAGIKHWTDMRTTQVITGNTGPGSTSFLIPRMMQQMLGLKIKLISGYKGSRKTILAMEQGEHQGTGFNWLAWNSIVPHWFEPGKEQAVALMQTGHYKDPDLQDVPMLRDVVDKKYAPIVKFMATLGIIGRGLALPPGAPKDALVTLRTAFDKMVKDADYNADAKKRRLRVIASTGQQVQDVVENAFKNADPKVVAQARKIIFGR